MKTVITYGVFDLFHEGHLSLLKRARELGDRLIVGVITDQFAYERGKYTVSDPLDVRLKHVMECPYADQVIVEDHFGQKIEDISKYRADIFAIGDDWLGKFDYLNRFCEVVYLPRTPGISSSALRKGKIDSLRLGIIGCGRVAGRFLRELSYVRDIRPTAFYHPDPDHSESVQKFRLQHPELPLARTPEKLFDLVDAVYIASPHGSHAAYAKAALEAGCHVLCEKPMAFCAEEAEDLFRIAERKQLVLMEALKTAYCQGFVRMISLLQSGVIGNICSIDACFTRLTPFGLREWRDPEYSGSFYEFGSYVMLPVIRLFSEHELTWSFHSVWRQGTDAFTRTEVRGNGMDASLKTGIGAKSPGELVVTGTEGFLVAEAPWWKTTDFFVGYEDPSRKHSYHFDYEGDGFRYEAADFLCRIRGDASRAFKLLPEDSVRMAEVYEQFAVYRKQNKG